MNATPEQSMQDVPYRPVRLADVKTVMERRADGSILLRASAPLDGYPHTVTERLLHWAQVAPDRVFLAQRDASGEWEKVTYAQTLSRVRSLAQALLNLGLNKDKPLMVLSENSLPHAFLGLAAMHVGIPYVPVSPPYSLVSTDYARLNDLLDVIQPALVFAADGRFVPALRSVVQPRGIPILSVRELPADLPAHVYLDLLNTQPTAEVEAAHDAIRPDDLAKILFTSGSTGKPKGVINTHRMIAANAAQNAQTAPFLKDEPPVLVDWLTWHHTFGGNKIFNLALHNGGTLYLDGGKATPQGILETVRNLREISPTVYFNIPKGYMELLPHLQQDAELRRSFFKNLQMMFYAAASLPPHVWEELERLSLQETGQRTAICSGLGSTESAPATLMKHWAGGQAGLLGVPMPGTEVKLVKVDDKWEARYKGPNIMPGYWREPEASANAFDGEGFYKTGDAVKLVNEDHPDEGLVFDGRIAEDFKLDTGTFVNVGPLRAAVVSAGAPLVQDAVITGHDQPFVGAIVFLNEVAAREFAGVEASDDLTTLTRHPKIVAHLQQALNKLHAGATGSSNRIERLTVAEFRPSLDAGEITDKGSLNQRAILRGYGDLVVRLHDSTLLNGILRPQSDMGDN